MTSIITQSAVKSRISTYQTGNLAFKMPKGVIETPQEVKILDKTINLKKGDDPSKVKKKILDVFDGDEDWTFETGYVVIEGIGASVKYTSKKIIDHVDELVKSEKENQQLKFIQTNDVYGDLGIAAQKEKCEVTITKASGQDEKISVNVKGTKKSLLNRSVDVQVNKFDDTKKIAESIYTEFSKDELIKRIYSLKLDKENSKIILIQNEPDPIETEVSIIK